MIILIDIFRALIPQDGQVKAENSLTGYSE